MEKEVNLEVSVDTEKATDQTVKLIQLLNTANSLADELADTLENLELDIKEPCYDGLEDNEVREVWIFQKRWNAMEQKIADLANEIRGRQINVKLDIPKGNAYDLVVKNDQERNINCT